MEHNPLGENTEYPRKYDPDILYPIPRWRARSELNIDKKIKMHGIDHWHAYEISWLDKDGRPEVRLGEFFFNAESENMVESKSLKLYLNSFNNEKFRNDIEVEQNIVTDLSKVSQSEVKVMLLDVNTIPPLDEPMRTRISIDNEMISDSIEEGLNESILSITNEVASDEELYSDLFRSNCPVTGQPDWASFYIKYTGPQIDRSSLLSYLCAYRNHQGYHEECAERIFRDVSLQCKSTKLKLSLNFLRRGGLDINVYRSTELMTSDMMFSRSERQ